MSSSATRVWLLGSVFGAGLVVVLLHLWLLMVKDQEVWARRSYQNRWAFRSVPSQRGALLDRNGLVLARDEPTTEVSCYYLRFRLRHVVGAAVHGATRWSSLREDGQSRIYGYRLGPVGPMAAARDLLGVPVAALRRGMLLKKVAGELTFYAVTVLSGCSGMSRRQSFAALREAAQSRLPLGIGDVLPMPRSQLLAAFEQRLGSLYDLDRLLLVEQQRRSDAQGKPTSAPPGLVATLEKLRMRTRDEHADRNKLAAEGKEPKGIPAEQRRRTFADDVSFEIAAALRVDHQAHPGIEVEPALRRTLDPDLGASLQALLGRVRAIDRTLDVDDPYGERSVGELVKREMPAGWLDELVPAGVVDTGDAREKLKEHAEQRYRRELLARERRGLAGFEQWFDDELMGRIGMRFVEHDSKRREQLLWSHLRVEAGEDVHLTIDVGLQRLAQAAAERTRNRFLPGHTTEVDRNKLEAALALIDARTGDVLAYAGAPITSQSARNVPGVWWKGNGAVGSVLKPIVLVEHLESARLGRPHRPHADISPCEGGLRFGNRWLSCDGVHDQRGRDPVVAIAKSCNVFFFQVGVGLGDAGLARGLQRFGLMSAEGDDPFAECWQPKIRGLGAAQPAVDLRLKLPQRAIGYGVAASPVHIARAYAGIATGALPTLRLRLDEAPRVVPLGDLDESLDVVRDGLRQCVVSGTARRLTRLDDYEVHGKTGTAEVGTENHENNAWFAGYVPWRGPSGVQLAFCAVVYWVPDGEHGADVAGEMVSDFLERVEADPQLRGRYLERR